MAEKEEKEWVLVKGWSADHQNALKKCEIAFNKVYCKNDMEKTLVNCLDVFAYNVYKNKDVEYMVGDYCLGRCLLNTNGEAKEDITIGLITDGKHKCGWFHSGAYYSKDEKYGKGIEDSRQIEME